MQKKKSRGNWFYIFECDLSTFCTFLHERHSDRILDQFSGNYPRISQKQLFTQRSPQAFSARSFLDSTMSCDVTERYSPALSQTSRGQRIKRERLGTRLLFTGYRFYTHFKLRFSIAELRHFFCDHGSFFPSSPLKSEGKYERLICGFSLCGYSKLAVNIYAMFFYLQTSVSATTGFYWVQMTETEKKWSIPLQSEMNLGLRSSSLFEINYFHR